MVILSFDEQYKVQQINALTNLTNNQLALNLSSILQSIQSNRLFECNQSTNQSVAQNGQLVNQADRQRFIGALLKFTQKITDLLEEQTKVPPQIQLSNKSASQSIKFLFVGLKLLQPILMHCDSSMMYAFHVTWMRLLTQSFNQSINQPLNQSVSLQCQVLIVCQCSSIAELRHPFISTSRTKLMAQLIDSCTSYSQSINQSINQTSHTLSHVLVRCIQSINQLLVVYGSELKDWSSKLETLFLNLMLNQSLDVTNQSINTLMQLVCSMTSSMTALSLRQARRAKQLKDQQAAQDEADEQVDDQPTETNDQSINQSANANDIYLSPYTQLMDKACRTLRAYVDEIRDVNGDPSTNQSTNQSNKSKSRSNELIDWSSLPSEANLRATAITRRIDVLCRLIQAAVQPVWINQSTNLSINLSFPLNYLLETLMLALQSAIRSTDQSNYQSASPLTASNINQLLPQLMHCSFDCLIAVTHSMPHCLINHSTNMSATFTELYHRLTSQSTNHSVNQSICTHFYALMAAFFTLPLSPSMTSAICKSINSALLTDCSKALLSRKQLEARTATERAQAQLKAHTKRKLSQTINQSTNQSNHASVHELATLDALSTAALQSVASLLEHHGSFLAAAHRVSIDQTLVACMLGVTCLPRVPVPADQRIAVVECVCASLMRPVSASMTAHVPALLPFVLSGLQQLAVQDDNDRVRAVAGHVLCCADWLRSEREGVSVGRRKRRVDAWQHEHVTDEVVDMMERVEDQAEEAVDDSQKRQALSAEHVDEVVIDEPVAEVEEVQDVEDDDDEVMEVEPEENGVVSQESGDDDDVIEEEVVSSDSDIVEVSAPSPPSTSPPVHVPAAGVTGTTRITLDSDDDSDEDFDVELNADAGPDEEDL